MIATIPKHPPVVGGGGGGGKTFMFAHAQTNRPHITKLLRTLDFLAEGEVEVLEGHRLQGLEIT